MKQYYAAYDTDWSLQVNMDKLSKLGWELFQIMRNEVNGQTVFSSVWVRQVVELPPSVIGTSIGVCPTVKSEPEIPVTCLSKEKHKNPSYWLADEQLMD